jgi:hypothetical protein
MSKSSFTLFISTPGPKIVPARTHNGNHQYKSHIPPTISFLLFSVSLGS